MTKESKKSKSAPKTERKRIRFQIQADPNSDVYLSGSFNNWDGKAKKLKDRTGSGQYGITLMLPSGRHEYKFVVDGEWNVDPECPDWNRNEFGTLNSVIVVK
jgi:1,4-alpha-glucan branching enzyme